MSSKKADGVSDQRLKENVLNKTYTNIIAHSETYEKENVNGKKIQ